MHSGNKVYNGIVIALKLSNTFKAMCPLKWKINLTYLMNLKRSGESSLDLGSTLSGNLFRAFHSRKRKFVWSSRSLLSVLVLSCSKKTVPTLPSGIFSLSISAMLSSCSSSSFCSSISIERKKKISMGYLIIASSKVSVPHYESNIFGDKYLFRQLYLMLTWKTHSA